MAICREKRGGKVYLAEYKSVRENGKVKHVFVRYLGREGPDGKPIKKPKRTLEKVKRNPARRAGDVTLLWKLTQDLQIIPTIDRFCCGQSEIEGPSPGKYLAIWAINRALDPCSCTKLKQWVKDTELPQLAGLEHEAFTKDAFLTALDFVCYKESGASQETNHTSVIDDELYAIWRRMNPLPDGQKEVVAYDLTTILFFGTTCPLAELGYNPKHIKQRQVNIALLVSKHDKAPMAHFTYNGSRNSSSTVKNLLARLLDSAIPPGTIIWDRGNVSKAHVQAVEKSNWDLICGIPKTSKAAKKLIFDTAIPRNPVTFVRKSKCGSIYAKKVRGNLYGRKRETVVYLNPKRQTTDADSRNQSLSEIGEELDALSERGADWSEKKLHAAIKQIVGKWGKYVQTRVSRKTEGPRVKWKYLDRTLDRASNSDGKYLLYATDESLAAKEVVTSYLDKDFIEKVFRTFKTDEKLEPARHRLETRVKGIIFVCVLAYRLLSALQYRLEVSQQKDHDISWERANALLEALSRVSRMEVIYGKQCQVWYLNVTKDMKDAVEALGYEGLFNDSNVESRGG